MISFFLDQRIEAEARVLKLEKELKEAKHLERQLAQSPQRSVGDIKRVISILSNTGFNPVIS